MGKKGEKAALKAQADAKAAELEAAAAPKPDFKQAMDRLKAIKAGEKILKKQKGGESDEAVSFLAARETEEEEEEARREREDSNEK